MAKVLIITAHVEHLEKIKINRNDFDCIICADGGMDIAHKLNLEADILIGDFDSGSKSEKSKCPDIITLPAEKDMTDSEAAIDLAISKNFDYITVLGGLGGRFDHTMGNLGMLAKYHNTIKHIAFMDGSNYIFMMSPGKIQIPKNEFKYLGVISYGTSSKNVTLRGVKYPLTNHFLTNDTSLGVSNEIILEKGEISFDQGMLLIILSKDVDK